MAEQGDFPQIAATLRVLMLASAPGMLTATDGPGGFSMNAPFANPLKPGEPCFFGMVKVGKAYVSYHLMPLYMNPALAALISPALKKRMQGKTCFNFNRIDPVLFDELVVLTRRCAEGYEEGVSRAVAAYKASKDKRP